jgi:hypothetical protein
MSFSNSGAVTEITERFHKPPGAQRFVKALLHRYITTFQLETIVTPTDLYSSPNIIG